MESLLTEQTEEKNLPYTCEERKVYYLTPQWMGGCFEGTSLSSHLTKTSLARNPVTRVSKCFRTAKDF